MQPIKKFEKYFMAHEYTPKIFHDPLQKPSGAPPTYLIYIPLVTFSLIVHILLFYYIVFNTRSKL